MRERVRTYHSIIRVAKRQFSKFFDGEKKSSVTLRQNALSGGLEECRAVILKFEELETALEYSGV